jgi:hypothetical protein
MFNFVNTNSLQENVALVGQLDRSVHIDPTVCPFWLKVWGMKNTCYIWPIHLIKMTFFYQVSSRKFGQNGQMSIQMAMV